MGSLLSTRKENHVAEAEAEAEALAESEYKAFPRDKRCKLHKAILEDETSPFRDKPGDTYDGLYFAVALSDNIAPITNSTFSEILDECVQLEGKNRAAMVRCFRTHMRAIQKV